MNGINQYNLYKPLSLRLQALAYSKLVDSNWTGMNLFDYIKTAIKGTNYGFNNKKYEFLRKVLHHGLLPHIGSWIYGEYLDPYIDDYYSYIRSSDLEDRVWYLEVVVEFLKFHNVDESKILNECNELLREINNLFNKDEIAYFQYLSRKKTKLINLYTKLYDYYEVIFIKLKNEYAVDLANKMFHDRSLCEFISQLLLIIGFDGSEDIDLKAKAWMKRVTTPKWAITLLKKRDSNLCASCRCESTSENKLTIDHIVPLSRGGCNDLVNLQLLCKQCNQVKNNNTISVNDSVPTYFQDRSFKRIHEKSQR